MGFDNENSGIPESQIFDLDQMKAFISESYQNFTNTKIETDPMFVLSCCFEADAVSPNLYEHLRIGNKSCKGMTGQQISKKIKEAMGTGEPVLFDSKIIATFTVPKEEKGPKAGQQNRTRMAERQQGVSSSAFTELQKATASLTELFTATLAKVERDARKRRADMIFGDNFDSTKRDKEIAAEQRAAEMSRQQDAEMHNFEELHRNERMQEEEKRRQEEIREKLSEQTQSNEYSLYGKNTMPTEELGNPDALADIGTGLNIGSDVYNLNNGSFSSGNGITPVEFGTLAEAFKSDIEHSDVSTSGGLRGQDTYAEIMDLIDANDLSPKNSYLFSERSMSTQEVTSQGVGFSKDGPSHPFNSYTAIADAIEKSKSDYIDPSATASSKKESKYESKFEESTASYSHFSSNVHDDTPHKDINDFEIESLDPSYNSDLQHGISQGLSSAAQKYAASSNMEYDLVGGAITNGVSDTVAVTRQLLKMSQSAVYESMSDAFAAEQMSSLVEHEKYLENLQKDLGDSPLKYEHILAYGDVNGITKEGLQAAGILKENESITLSDLTGRDAEGNPIANDKLNSLSTLAITYLVQNDVINMEMVNKIQHGDECDYTLKTDKINAKQFDNMIENTNDKISKMKKEMQELLALKENGRLSIKDNERLKQLKADLETMNGVSSSLNIAKTKMLRDKAGNKMSGVKGLERQLKYKLKSAAKGSDETMLKTGMNTIKVATNGNLANDAKSKIGETARKIGRTTAIGYTLKPIMKPVVKAAAKGAYTLMTYRMKAQLRYMKLQAETTRKAIKTLKEMFKQKMRLSNFAQVGHNIAAAGANVMAAGTEAVIKGGRALKNSKVIGKFANTRSVKQIKRFSGSFGRQYINFQKTRLKVTGHLLNSGITGLKGVAGAASTLANKLMATKLMRILRQIMNRLSVASKFARIGLIIGVLVFVCCCSGGLNYETSNQSLAFFIKSDGSALANDETTADSLAGETLVNLDAWFTRSFKGIAKAGLEEYVKKNNSVSGGNFQGVDYESGKISIINVDENKIQSGSGYLTAINNGSKSLTNINNTNTSVDSRFSDADNRIQKYVYNEHKSAKNAIFFVSVDSDIQYDLVKCAYDYIPGEGNYDTGKYVSKSTADGVMEDNYDHDDLMDTEDKNKHNKGLDNSTLFENNKEIISMASVLLQNDFNTSEVKIYDSEKEAEEAQEDTDKAKGVSNAEDFKLYSYNLWMNSHFCDIKEEYKNGDGKNLWDKIKDWLNDRSSDEKIDDYYANAAKTNNIYLTKMGWVTDDDAINKIAPLDKNGVTVESQHYIGSALITESMSASSKIGTDSEDIQVKSQFGASKHYYANTLENNHNCNSGNKVNNARTQLNIKNKNAEKITPKQNTIGINAAASTSKSVQYSNVDDNRKHTVVNQELYISDKPVKATSAAETKTKGQHYTLTRNKNKQNLIDMKNKVLEGSYSSYDSIAKKYGITLSSKDYKDGEFTDVSTYKNEYSGTFDESNLQLTTDCGNAECDFKSLKTLQDILKSFNFKAGDNQTTITESTKISLVEYKKAIPAKYVLENGNQYTKVDSFGENKTFVINDTETERDSVKYEGYIKGLNNLNNNKFNETTNVSHTEGDKTTTITIQYATSLKGQKTTGNGNVIGKNNTTYDYDSTNPSKLGQAVTINLNDSDLANYFAKGNCEDGVVVGYSFKYKQGNTVEQHSPKINEKQSITLQTIVADEGSIIQYKLYPLYQLSTDKNGKVTKKRQTYNGNKIFVAVGEAYPSTSLPPKELGDYANKYQEVCSFYKFQAYKAPTAQLILNGGINDISSAELHCGGHTQICIEPVVLTYNGSTTMFDADGITSDKAEEASSLLSANSTLKDTIDKRTKNQLTYLINYFKDKNIKSDTRQQVISLLKKAKDEENKEDNKDNKDNKDKTTADNVEDTVDKLSDDIWNIETSDGKENVVECVNNVTGRWENTYGFKWKDLQDKSNKVGHDLGLCKEDGSVDPEETDYTISHLTATEVNVSSLSTTPVYNSEGTIDSALNAGTENLLNLARTEVYNHIENKSIKYNYSSQTTGDSYKSTVREEADISNASDKESPYDSTKEDNHDSKNGAYEYYKKNEEAGDGESKYSTKDIEVTPKYDSNGNFGSTDIEQEMFSTINKWADKKANNTNKKKNKQYQSRIDRVNRALSYVGKISYSKTARFYWCSTGNPLGLNWKETDCGLIYKTDEVGFLMYLLGDDPRYVQAQELRNLSPSKILTNGTDTIVNDGTTITLIGKDENDEYYKSLNEYMENENEGKDDDEKEPQDYQTESIRGELKTPIKGTVYNYNASHLIPGNLIYTEDTCVMYAFTDPNGIVYCVGCTADDGNSQLGPGSVRLSSMTDFGIKESDAYIIDVDVDAVDDSKVRDTSYWLGRDDAKWNALKGSSSVGTQLGDNSTWIEAAHSTWMAMWNYCKDNGLTGDPYSQTRTVNISLSGVNKPTRFDCSGFVCTALNYFGIDVPIANTTGMMNDTFESAMEKGGFSKLPPDTTLQDGDIIVWPGHTEIVTKINKMASQKLNWGEDDPVIRASKNDGYSTASYKDKASSHNGEAAKRIYRYGS